MEVEVKLRLHSLKTFNLVLQLFREHGKFLATDRQENYFVDGAQKELSSERAILRFRRCLDPDNLAVKKCLLTLKARSRMVDGVSRVEELENTVSVTDMDCLLSGSNVKTAFASTPVPITGAFDALVPKYNVLKHVATQFKAKEYMIVGCFETFRSKFEWALQDGTKQLLEIDRTVYEFGEAYEIEAESNNPDYVQSLLEEFLKTHKVDFTHSKRTKFGNFINKSIL